MPRPEQPFHSERPHLSSEAPLPPELAAFLKDRDYAALWQPTNHGTAMVIKAPGAEIASVRGTVPIRLQHVLYEHPRAPVIRSLLRIYDRPDSHFAVETYTNIAEQDQHDDFAALAKQREIVLLFYNDHLTHDLTKRIGNTRPEDIEQIVRVAEHLRRRIPPDQYDFDLAKQRVMEVTML